MSDPAASRHERVSEVLSRARRLAGPERDAFIRDACGEDAGLRAEVESLLEHVSAPEAFLDPEGLASRIREQASSILAEDDARLPQSIGGHRVVRLIGEGAMGVVYEAEQDKPRRRVALKVLRRGIASAQHLRRFEREVALLARLNHPGIARVHAAGIDESDPLSPARPWFTMELVRGVPLTTFARRDGMTTARRLELLALTCEAVAHAHEQGIVHRDLKPANILVDDAGQPHVLDFGIAVAAGADEFTRATRTGDVIGTLSYMSPEQATGHAATADARSDVHALGVIGFEILAGRLPFDLDDLPLPAVAQRIAHDDAPSLSDLDPGLRGGPATIIAKALEKDPARRYANAGEMAADLRRLLADEPLVAQPPTVTENLRRAARRHRAFVIGSIATIVALSIGLAAAVRMAVVAERARADEAIAREAAATQRDLARDRLYESLMREARALRMNRQPGYRRELFDRLRQAAGLAAAGWNAEAIRSEASLSLGDPVAQEPVRLVIPDAGVLPEGKPKTETDAIDGTGRLVAYGTSFGLLSVHDATTGSTLTTLEGQGPIAQLAFASPSRLFGTLAAPDPAEGEPRSHHRVAEWRAEAGAWTLHSSKEVPHFEGLLATRAGAVGVVLQPWTGRHLLLDLATDAALGSVPHEPLTLSADRRVAALRSRDGESIMAWTLSDGRVRTWHPGLGGIQSAAFNDEGTLLACHGQNGVVVLDLARPEPLCAFRGYFQEPGFLDRTTLALPQAQSRTLRLVNVATNNDVARLAFDAWRFRFGREVVLAVGTGEGRVVQLGDTPERRRFLGHAGGVPALTFSGDGRQLVTIGKDETIRLWDVATGRQSGAWEGLGGPAQALSLRPDGRFLATAEWSAKVVRVWSMETGRVVLTLDRPEDILPLVTSVSFSPDGRRLVASGSCHQIWEITETAEGLSAREIHRQGGLSWAHAFDSSGSMLAYTAPPQRGAGLEFLRVGVEGAKPDHVTAAMGTIQSIGHSPRDGQFVFVATGIRLEFVDLGKMAVVRRLPTLFESEAAGAAIGNLRVSGDGRSAAVGSASSRGVNIVDLATGERRFALPDAVNSVWWLAWSPDDTKLAVSTSDGEVFAWDLEVARRLLDEAGLWQMKDPREGG